MASIQLTKGLAATVDDKDAPRLQEYKWQAMDHGRRLYAATSIKGRTTYMHAMIAGTPSGMCTDHINHDGLDNRRENLRIVTRAQNCWNARKFFRKTSSRFKGVYWHKGARKWNAYFRRRGDFRHLGLFDDELEAARAYDTTASEVYGEFAKLNFPNKHKENYEAQRRFQIELSGQGRPGPTGNSHDQGCRYRNHQG